MDGSGSQVRWEHFILIQTEQVRLVKIGKERVCGSVPRSLRVVRVTFIMTGSSMIIWNIYFK